MIVGGMGGGGASQEDDIWNQILSESTRKVNSNTMESKTVVILGDRNCGKSSLISSLQKDDSITGGNKGVALTYSFADVFESENEDPTGRIDFWQLEGEVSHRDLLQFGLNEKTTDSAMVIITLDLSQPWAMVESLRKWLSVLQTHLSTVYPLLDSGGGTNSQKTLLERLQVVIQTYTEPSTDTPDTPTSTSVPTTNSAAKRKKKRAPQSVDLAVLPPLDKAVLSNNLGVPIVVACCKCDCMVALEKDFDYNEGMFEYIQQYIRRICLSYGAALIYTSSRKDTNCSLLMDYVEHRLFGFEFRNRCQLVEKESIFVPAGWDNMLKINLDFENQKICKDPEEAYENVIKKPNIIKRREQTHATMIAAEDDQEFLQRHKVKLESDVTDKKEDPNNEKADLLSTFKKLGGGILPTSGPSEAPAPDDEDEDIPRSNKASGGSGAKKPAEAKVSQPTPAVAKESGTTAVEKKALTDFFTSLMKKPAATRSESVNDLSKMRPSKK